MQVWLDGRLVPATSACVSPLDAGFRLGDGVFSTLLAVDGVPQLLDAHVARVVHDAAALGITGLPADRFAEALRTTALANVDEHPTIVLRLVVTRGAAAPDAPFGTVPNRPTVAVLASPPPPPRATTTLATVEGGRRPAAIKSTSWAWSAHAIATARAAGADSALLVEGDDVLEAAAANVVVVHDGVARTPPADGRLLPGLTREVLLRHDAVAEEPVTRAALATADEVAVTSAVRGVLPVVAIDDQPVGDGTPGPVVTALQEVLAAALQGRTTTSG